MILHQNCGSVIFITKYNTKNRFQHERKKKFFSWNAALGKTTHQGDLITKYEVGLKPRSAVAAQPVTAGP